MDCSLAYVWNLETNNMERTNFKMVINRLIKPKKSSTSLLLLFKLSRLPEKGCLFVFHKMLQKNSVQ